MPFQLPDLSTIYKNDKKLNKEDVNCLSEWIKSQSHLPQLEEFQVVLFLHSCYYQLEHAKATIENYFSFRTSSDLFKEISQDLVTKVLKSFFISFMPVRTSDDNAILLIRLLDVRPELFNCVEHTKVLFLILCLYYYQNGPANGLCLIFDMQGSTFGHMIRTSPLNTKRLCYFVQEAAPTRLKNVHIININPITAKMMSIVKPFIRKEVFDLIKIHPTMNSFYEFIPKENLPEEHGGTLGPLLKIQEKNLNNILSNWDFVSWHYEQLVDETKRVTKQKSFYQTVQGLFR